MRINRVALVLIFLLACLMITPAMAETLTGTLGETGVNTTMYQMGSSSGHSAYPVSSLKIKDIENTAGLSAVIEFNGAFMGGVTHTFDSGAPPGVSIPVTVRLADATVDVGGAALPTIKDGEIIGTGSIGYQRFFNSASPPAETTGGYIYVVLNNWTIGSLTGEKYLYLDYNRTAFYNASLVNTATGDVDVTKKISFRSNNYLQGGDYLLNYNIDTWANYVVTKPYGLGISGSVIKSQPNGTLFYNSRAFILNATGGVIASDNTTNPTTMFFNVPYDQIKIGILTNSNHWYNSTLLFNATSVTPTPTPIAGAVYTISTSTDYVNVSGTNTVTIASLTDPTLSDLKFIGASYSDTPSGAETPFYEVGSTVHALMYSLIGATWNGYDSADVDYNNAKGAIPNPLTLKWDTTSGDKTLHVTLQNSAGDYTYLTRTIHVGQGTQTLIQTRAQAMDGTNGGNLGMVSMQIYNHNTATWTNLSPNDGLGSIITPPNTILSFYAQKAGFTDGSLLNQPARADLIYAVNLFSGPAALSGYVNYYVTVKDLGGYSIPGALITISTGGSSKLGTSSQYGGAQIFNLTNSTLYTWTVTKTGYSVRSGSFTTPASGSGSLDVVMSPLVTPTRTTAPIPTGSWTIIPGTTSTGNGTFWLPWKNVFTMMGASSTELPLLIAGIIIVLCMAAGAGMAGVLGAEVMMGFGAIFCVALGLIPIWVVLAIIILGFLFYGLKIGGK